MILHNRQFPDLPSLPEWVFLVPKSSNSQFIIKYLQADYVLGKNRMQMSYLVGYGSNYPQYVHHRGASIPTDAHTGCKDGFKWLNSTKPNPNIVMGALVGGPFLNDTYIDSRNNSMQGEPTTYSNAAFVGLLSGLITTSPLASSFL